MWCVPRLHSSSTYTRTPILSSSLLYIKSRITRCAFLSQCNTDPPTRPLLPCRVPFTLSTMATAVHAPTPLSSTPSTSPTSSVSMSPRRFALAKVHHDVCLVQGKVFSLPSVTPHATLFPNTFSFVLPPRSPSTVCSSLAQESCHSALSAIEAQIYAHEFITIFRYSHPALLHPSDIRILEWLDEQSVLDEEDKGTVFLARDVMERLRRLTDRRLSIGARPSYSSRGGRRML